jgi:methyl-accepting chemotaxis protein/methyl-accepting chemotaxis protein-1 (serine sensor receptor)
MTVGKKLMLSVGAMMALVLVLAYSTLSSLDGLGQNLHTVITKTTKKVDLIGEVNVGISNMSRAQRGLVLYSMLKDPSKAEEVGKPFLTTADAIDKQLAELRPLIVVERGRQLTENIASSIAAWRPLYSELASLCGKQQFDSELKATINKMVADGVDASKAVDELAQIQRDQLAADLVEADAAASRTRWIAVGLIGICLAVGIVVFFIVRQINVVLRRLASEMFEGAEQVAGASGQVSGSSQSLAQGASEQAASLEETSASSEEMSSMTRKNSENSQEAAVLMNGVSQRVAEANRTLADMTTSMEEIGASSGKISKIIKVIDEIAFQTNILALNAAVEAARAGEAGMGFAVVADEVRNLAQRSAQAAKDTAALIEDSILKSSDGSRKLGDVANSIQGITEGAIKVKTLVDEVEASSKEQATGIEQISKAVAQMDEVTQRTAANAEESASASEELSAQSQALIAVADQLRALVGGDSGNSSGAKVSAPKLAPVIRAVQSHRSLAVPTAHARKPAGVLAGAIKRRAPEFPLDDSEFKEF